MNELKKVLTDSFKLIVKKPVLFLPKLLIAFLYSIPMIFLPKLTLASIDLTSNKIGLINSLLFWLIIIFLISILDVLFNSMYSFNAKNFVNKKTISLKSSIKSALKKFKTVFSSILLTDLIFIFLAIIVSIPFSIVILTNSTGLIILFAIIYAVLIFVLFVAFYLIYPVASLEKLSTINSIKKSVFLARKNFKKISTISIFSFFLSFASISIPFVIELFIQNNSNLLFLTIFSFILVRFLTAIISTYYYVLNPMFYLEGELK